MEARQERQRKAEEAGDTSLEKMDIFSRLLSAKDPETGEGLSQKQLWAESNLLIIAGKLFLDRHLCTDTGRPGT